MSKSTYFTGQPVYSQVIKLLDKAKIQIRLKGQICSWKGF